MWQEFGRAIRTCWAWYLVGAAIHSVARHIDLGATVVLFEQNGMPRIYLPGLN